MTAFSLKNDKKERSLVDRSAFLAVWKFRCANMGTSS